MASAGSTGVPALPADARPGDLVRIRGDRWRIVRRFSYEATALIETDGCDAANRGIRSRFLLPFEPVDPVAVSPTPRVVRPTRWRRVARRVLGDATPGWAALRAATRARFDIVPFQLEPALALVRGDGCRFLIADAVGLGKTVQAGLMIAEVLQRQPDARAIVVCPAGLREQWQEELHTRFDLNADVLDTAGVARSTAHLPVGLNPWSAHSLVITSIDYVKRPEVMRSLETLIWDLVILDEAHGLAGRSDRAAAAAALASRARFVVMLTATPHSGDADAFRRMCNIGRLGEDDPLLLFSRARADAGIPGSRRTVLLRVRPTAAEAAMHDALGAYARLVWRQASEAGGNGARLAMSVLARRACSSAASLERSVQRRLALLGHDEQQAMPQLALPFGSATSDDAAPDSQLAAPGLSDADEERSRLTRILALARDASRAESKLAALRRLVFRTTESAIVFTEYRDTLEHLASALPGVTFVRLHGGLTPRERADALRQFTSGSVRLLLATDAASEGLNLHHRCRLVVHLELPWTPLRLEQRVGRVDRIGQIRRVHAVHLIARATSEELVLSKLAERVRRVRAAMGPFAFPAFAGDQEVAEAVLGLGPPKPGEGGGTPVAESAAPSIDAGVVNPVLIREGREEANRILLARSLLLHAAEEVRDPRATVTLITPRRNRSCSPRALWVFGLLLVDEQGRGVSEELLAFACGQRTSMRGKTPSALRALLNRCDFGLREVAGRAGDERLAAFAQELEASLHLWLRREEALSAALRVAHARLSAQLLQLGLFDRRNERAATAQSVLLDEALAKSAMRSNELLERQRLRVESSELVFAVAFE